MNFMKNEIFVLKCYYVIDMYLLLYDWIVLNLMNKVVDMYFFLNC